MINIVVEDSALRVEIEQFDIVIKNSDDLLKLIEHILDKTKYGGEAICLEKRKDGLYTMINRW
jgi:hypothetical protein